MLFQDRQRLLNRIVSGKHFGNVELPDGKELYTIFTDPDVNLSTEADFVFTTAFEDAKSGGLPTVEESVQILKERGGWSDSEDKQLDSFAKSLKSMREQFSALQYQKLKQKQLAAAIKGVELSIVKLEKKKNALWSSTANYAAELSKRRFLIRRIVKIANADLLEDQRVLNSLIVYYYDKAALEDKEIRELSRTSPWRVMWMASKETGTPLFSRPTSEITTLQYNLLNWTLIYEFAFNSSNKPGDDVINDDIKFDAWYQNEIQRLESEDKRREFDKDGKVGVGSEVFIVADEEGAKEVFALNDNEGKSRIKQRQKFINEAKRPVAEGELPDVKQAIVMKANQAMFNKK